MRAYLMRPIYSVHVLIFITLAMLSLNLEAWTREEGFNEGDVGQSVQSTGAMDDAAGGTKYSAEQSFDGTLSAKMSIAAGATGFGSWGGIVNFPNDLRSGDSYWVQFYMYIPDSFYISTPTNGSLKFLRIRTATAQGSNGGYNDFQIMDDGTRADAVYRFIKEGVWDRGWMEIGSSSERSTLLPRDRWFKVELALSFGVSPVSEGGNSYVRLWIDDQLVWNGTNAQTLSGSDHIADALYIFTYWNGDAPQSQSLYIDNLIMTSDTPSNRDSRGNPYIGDRGISGSGGEVVEPATAPPARIEGLTVE
ncbi:MAG: hypothetical protein ACX933_01055 [Marinobacter adhaerens]